MPIQLQPASGSWRNHLRFSLRGLIVAVLLLGVWLAWMVRSARIQRQAVAAIRKAHGRILYDWQWRNGHWIPVGKPLAPRWLVDAVGVDFFGNVAWVTIPSVSDDDLFHIGQLGQLRDLTITEKLEMTDVGRAYLKGLKNLRILRLRGGMVTFHTLIELQQGSPNLQVIY